MIFGKWKMYGFCSCQMPPDEQTFHYILYLVQFEKFPSLASGFHTLFSTVQEASYFVCQISYFGCHSLAGLFTLFVSLRGVSYLFCDVSYFIRHISGGFIHNLQRFIPYLPHFGWFYTLSAGFHTLFAISSVISYFILIYEESATCCLRILYLSLFGQFHTLYARLYTLAATCWVVCTLFAAFWGVS